MISAPYYHAATERVKFRKEKIEDYSQSLTLPFSQLVFLRLPLYIFLYILTSRLRNLNELYA